jgi:hypothetical protein
LENVGDILDSLEPNDVTVAGWCLERELLVAYLDLNNDVDYLDLSAYNCITTVYKEIVKIKYEREVQNLL